MWGPNEVDLLLVIDNTEGMEGPQNQLVAELPTLVESLTSSDRDGDGVRESRANSLHLGVITTDMGSGQQRSVPTCAPGLGDDGILRRTSLSAPSCMASYPSGTFAFMRDEASTELVASVSCVARMGTSGCAYSQPLEAALKALTPETWQIWTRAGVLLPEFADGAHGHGTGANAEFIRPNSVLAIVFLTNEDDMSLRDDALMAPSFSETAQPIRAAVSPEYAHPVSRYIDGFVGLRRSADGLVFGVFAGIPPEEEEHAATGNFALVLANPEMVPRANAASTALEPSCRRAAISAAPPSRFVETAGGLWALGARVTMSSICADSYAPAMARVVDMILARGACLPRPLSSEPRAPMDCSIHEVLPPAGPGVISECAMLPGRTAIGWETSFSGEVRQRCLVARARHLDTDAETPGWFITPRPNCYEPPLEFNVPVAPFAEVRAACTRSFPFSDAPRGLGENCVYDQDRCPMRGTSPSGAPLTCDPIARICTVACIQDTDCEAAGLEGFVCDTRTIEDAEAGYWLPYGLDLSAPRNVCINPSC